MDVHEHIPTFSIVIGDVIPKGGGVEIPDSFVVDDLILIPMFISDEVRDAIIDASLKFDSYTSSWHFLIDSSSHGSYISHLYFQ